jgi:hypothetical protein
MTLLFFPPSTQEPAMVALTVPRGSELTLDNVALEDDDAVPETIRTTLPPGEVLGDAECGEGNGGFDLDLDGTVFEVVIDDHTFIAGGRTCANLTAGSSVKVDGFQDGLTITASRITIAKGADPPRS